MTQLDIDRLAEITRAAMAARRAGAAPGDSSSPSPTAPAVPGAPSPAELEELGWHRSPAQPMPRASHRSALGPVAEFTKRAVHRVLRPFIVDALARQEQFNEATIAALQSVAVDSAHRVERDDEFRAELHSLRNLVDRLARELAGARRGRTDPEMERALEGLRAAVVRRAEVSGDEPKPLGSMPSDEDAERYRKFHEDASVFETTLEIYRQYVPYFRDCRRVLDLACGRGPFLTLLHRAGVSSYGVDFNPVFVAEARERGLEAVQGEAVEHLLSLAPESLDGVFSGHLVEHMDPEALLRLFQQVHRVLPDDGVFVIESPNTADLGVLAGAYFRDLTHQMPRHPETYQFLARAAGFASVEMEHSYPLEAVQRMREIPSGSDLDAEARLALSANFERLNELLFGPRNFALVCRKGPPES